MFLIIIGIGAALVLPYQKLQTLPVLCSKLYPGVRSLQHAYAKQFPMARRSSEFHISILLWFTKKVYLSWLASKIYFWHTEWFETL